MTAQGVLSSLTSESITVETVIFKSLGCDESQMMFLKDSETPRYFVRAINIFITLRVCLLQLFCFSFLDGQTAESSGVG